MEFHDLMSSASPNVSNYSVKARSSFLQGRYVEALELQGKFLFISAVLVSSYEEGCFNCLVNYLVAKYWFSLNKVCDYQI